MHIVDVIPITRGIGKEHLSYFTKHQFPVGHVITVPLRKKEVPALVVHTKDARADKAQLRRSDFATRKVSSKTSQPLFTKPFIATAHTCADFFAHTTGAVLNALTPSAITSHLDSITRPDTQTSQPTKPKLKPELFATQGDSTERYAHYKNQIRENFAQKKSVIFLVPTRNDMYHLPETLTKGIEHYTYTFHGGLKKEQLIEQWNKVVTEPHPVLIIATYSFLSMPRGDIGTIILEHENSTAYKQQARPFLDARIVAETYARHLGARFILGDTVLRTETIWRERAGEILPMGTLKFRTTTSAEQTIINMKRTRATTSQEEKTPSFTLFAPPVKKCIKQSIANGKRIVLIGARTGIASTTVCADCGTTVLCASCASPVVLHENGDETIFLCHTCGTSRPTAEYCSKCESWNLVPLGIGVERIAEHIRDVFPDTPVFEINKRATKTHAQARKLASEFLATPGSVCVGTSMVLDYLPHEDSDTEDLVENTVVVSLDALFAIPDFRIHERIVHMITTLRLRTRDNLFIQTRLPEHSVFSYASEGNLLDFFRDEIKDRETFGYPPVTRFVKITLAGHKQRVTKRMAELAEYLADYSPRIVEGLRPDKRSRFVSHALIAIPRAKWPHMELIELLRSLPHEYTCDVEPTTIL